MSRKKYDSLLNAILIIIGIIILCACAVWKYKWETRNDSVKDEVKALRQEIINLKKKD